MSNKRFLKKYEWFKPSTQIDYSHCYIKSTAEVIASIWLDVNRGFYVVEFYDRDNDYTYFVDFNLAKEYAENNCDWDDE